MVTSESFPPPMGTNGTPVSASVGSSDTSRDSARISGVVC